MAIESISFHTVQPYQQSRRFRSRSGVQQIVIGELRALAVIVDVSMANAIIDGPVKIPVLKAEKK